MLLKQHLAKYKKDDLKIIAEDFELRKISQLNKKDLSHLISEKMKEDEEIIELFSCLPIKLLELYKRLYAGETINLSPGSLADNFLIHLNICDFDYNNEALILFDDYKIDPKYFEVNEFKQKQNKKEWLVKCIEYACYYYEMFTAETLLKLYNIKIKANIDEMIDDYNHLLLNITDTIFCNMDDLGMLDWPTTHPIYSSTGLFLPFDTFYDDERIDELLHNQNDKPYYIPTKDEIENNSNFSFEILPTCYKKLDDFLQKNIGLDEAISKYITIVYFLKTSKSEDYHDTIETFMDMIPEKYKNDDADTELKKMNAMFRIINECHNNTKMLYNRGYSPNEVSSFLEKPKGPLTIVPGSSHTAKMLEEVSKIKKYENIKFDLESNADYYDSISFENGLEIVPVIKKKKVYPNDPCPCGSGLKYKQCCGKSHK